MRSVEKNNNNKKKVTEFDYKLVCNQLTIIHYVSLNKIIHMYFKSYDLFNESCL
jgi:hypothetical protein